MNTAPFLKFTFHVWEKPLLTFLPFSTISQDKLLVSKDTCRPPPSIQFKHCVLVSFVKVCILSVRFFFFLLLLLHFFPSGGRNQAVRGWRVLKGHFWMKNCLCALFFSPECRVLWVLVKGAPAEQTCLKVPFSLSLSFSAFTYESPESVINCGRKKRKTKNVGLFRTF